MKLNHGLILILGLMLSPPAPAETLASAAAAREWRMANEQGVVCLLYTSPSPRDVEESRMPSSA